MSAEETSAHCTAAGGCLQPLTPHWIRSPHTPPRSLLSFRVQPHDGAAEDDDERRHEADRERRGQELAVVGAVGLEPVMGATGVWGTCCV